jgi:choline dehydrogenase
LLPKPDKYALRTAPESNADYVVVGGGTAGCVLAARLSESPKNQVMLIEAGPRDLNPLIHIPMGFSKLLHSKNLNWRYSSIAQHNLQDREIYFPRGKVLGGSSAINGLIWVRGASQDFDDWADITGDRRWTWDACQRHFQRCEKAEQSADSRLGRGGAIPLSSATVKNEAVDRFLEACLAMGLDLKASLAISDTPGVGHYLTTSRKGLRVSSATAYLKDARKRKNLQIITNAQVSEILFDHENTATGVVINSDNTRQAVRARRGVVLSAGTVGSPQLLMLSGIGAVEQLRSHGIPIRVDAPEVGRNLQDHFSARVMARIAPPVSINSDFRRPWRLVMHALRYALRRDGPMSMGGAYAGAFFSPSGNSRPSMQVHFLPLSMRGIGWQFHPFSGVTANVCQLRPKSRGIVSLSSNDFRDDAVIDPGYLSDPDDQTTLVHGVQYVRKILQNPAFSTPMQSRELAPGPDATSDEETLRYIRECGSTVFHPVGTCRMGADATSVATSQGQVRGTRNLWVADASNMPTIPSGNTNAATAMIAEQISEIISQS